MGEADGQLTMGEGAGAQVVKCVQVCQVKLAGVVKPDFVRSFHLPRYGDTENIQVKRVH